VLGETNEDSRDPSVPLSHSDAGLFDSPTREDENLPIMAWKPVGAFHEGHLLFHDQIVADLAVHAHTASRLSGAQSPPPACEAAGHHFTSSPAAPARPSRPAAARGSARTVASACSSAPAAGRR